MNEPDAWDGLRSRMAGTAEDLLARSLRLDSPANGPPLILLFKHKLRPEAITNLRASWEAAWKGDAPGPKVVAIEDGEVLQLIDGRWKKVE